MKKLTLITTIMCLSCLFSGCAKKDAPAVSVFTDNSNVSVETSSTSATSSEVKDGVVSKIYPTISGQEDLFGKYKTATIKTNMGDIVVELYGDDSPKTVNNFLNLAKQGFYNSTKFHRVIKDFMIQGGDPNSKDDDFSNDGMGGPGYAFADEFNTHKLVRGSLAMANSGANTNGSQFFIVTKESTPWLDGAHTNFGQVISGMKTVDAIEAMSVDANSHPIKNATILSIELK
jgi:peptidyl-prolyl cis-trans isomerase B (cyclophilin B)